MFSIPRADDLAGIATEYPGAKFFSEFFWYWSFVFDGPIADASVCVEDVRGDECIGGTSLKAGLAGSAVSGLGLCGMGRCAEFCIGEDGG